MTYEQIQQEARDRRIRHVDTDAAGVSAVTGVRRAFTAGGKAAARPAGTPGAERQGQRRSIARAQGHGLPWMDKPQQPRRSGSRIDRPSASCSNPAGIAPRLQSLRGHAVPAELRPDEARRNAGSLQVHRLHGRRRNTGRSANDGESGSVATSQKNANGSPATGRSTGKTSRHGTRRPASSGEIADFVPPRDKTPCFWASLRPATGHLYRLTICSGILGRHSGSGWGQV